MNQIYFEKTDHTCGLSIVPCSICLINFYTPCKPCMDVCNSLGRERERAGFLAFPAMSSGRPPPQEEDQQNRSTKKAKTRGDEEGETMSLGGVSPKSYRDSVLHARGAYNVDFDPTEVWEEDVAENKWYKEDPENEPVNSDFDPCPVIPVSQEEYKKWCSDWELSLVVHLLGKRVSIKILESRLRSFWVKDGDIHIIDLPQDYFLVQFSAETNYLHALFEGPWLVANHYLIVQRWRSFFMRSVKTVRKIAAWVRIPELPIELYNEKFL